MRYENLILTENVIVDSKLSPNGFGLGEVAEPEAKYNY